jgi:hypothetical protein
MSKRRTPHEKKADSYRRDWRTNSRIDQSALRVGRRRRKAGINRANRRIARTQLAATSNDRVDILIPQRPPWRRWHVPVRLDRWVESRLDGRREHAGWNYFKQPYETERHRVRFAAFLTALLATSGDEARHLVPVWQDRLEDHFTARPWLESFFEDEPALRDSLNAWIATVDTELDGVR